MEFHTLEHSEHLINFKMLFYKFVVCLSVCLSWTHIRIHIRIQGTTKRKIKGHFYTEEKVGNFVVRGDNIVLFGKFDEQTDDQKMKLVSEKEFQMFV